MRVNRLRTMIGSAVAASALLCWAGCNSANNESTAENAIGAPPPAPEGGPPPPGGPGPGGGRSSPIRKIMVKIDDRRPDGLTKAIAKGLECSHPTGRPWKNSRANTPSSSRNWRNTTRRVAARNPGPSSLRNSPGPPPSWIKPFTPRSETTPSRPAVSYPILACNAIANTDGCRAEASDRAVEAALDQAAVLRQAAVPRRVVLRQADRPRVAVLRRVVHPRVDRQPWPGRFAARFYAIS